MCGESNSWLTAVSGPCITVSDEWKNIWQWECLFLWFLKRSSLQLQREKINTLSQTMSLRTLLYYDSDLHLHDGKTNISVEKKSCLVTKDFLRQPKQPDKYGETYATIHNRPIKNIAFSCQEKMTNGRTNMRRSYDRWTDSWFRKKRLWVCLTKTVIEMWSDRYRRKREPKVTCVIRKGNPTVGYMWEHKHIRFMTRKRERRISEELSTNRKD